VPAAQGFLEFSGTIFYRFRVPLAARNFVRDMRTFVAAGRFE
jgi:hypothetical protein